MTVRAGRWENVVAGAGALMATLVTGGILAIPDYTETARSADGMVAYGVASPLANDAAVLPAIMLPVALAALPLLFQRHPRRRIVTVVCATLLLGFCLIAGFSIGLFYVPAALLVLASIAVGSWETRAA